MKKTSENHIMYKMNNSEAVSYTHLDVYKRQIQYRGVKSQIGISYPVGRHMFLTDQ